MYYKNVLTYIVDRQWRPLSGDGGLRSVDGRRDGRQRRPQSGGGDMITLDDRRRKGIGAQQAAILKIKSVQKPEDLFPCEMQLLSHCRQLNN